MTCGRRPVSLQARPVPRSRLQHQEGGLSQAPLVRSERPSTQATLPQRGVFAGVGQHPNLAEHERNLCCRQWGTDEDAGSLRFPSNFSITLRTRMYGDPQIIKDPRLLHCRTYGYDPLLSRQLWRSHQGTCGTVREIVPGHAQYHRWQSL